MMMGGGRLVDAKKVEEVEGLYSVAVGLDGLLLRGCFFF